MGEVLPSLLIGANVVQADLLSLTSSPPSADPVPSPLPVLLS